MKCKDCQKPGQFFCPCSNINLCEEHLKSHTATGSHLFEEYKHKLTKIERHLLKKELTSRISQIYNFISDLNKNAKAIISKIESLKNENILEMYNKVKLYYRLLHQESYLQADYSEAKRIINSDFEVIFNKDLCITDDIKNFFSQPRWEEKEAEGKVNRWVNKQLVTYHNSGFRCGVVSHDQNYLITGSTDTTLRVWSLKEKQQTHVLEGHYATVNCLALTRSSNLLVSGSDDQSLIIWNTDTFKKESILKGHKGSIYAVHVTANDEVLISGGYKFEVIFWNLVNKEIINKLDLKGSLCCILTTEKNHLMALGINQSIDIWNIQKSSKISTLIGHQNTVSCMALTKSENFLLSASYDTSIIIWDFVKISKIASLNGHKESIYALTISPDDLLVVSGSKDKSVRVWNIQSRQQVHIFDHHKGSIYGLVFYENKLITLSDDGGIGFLNMESKSLIGFMHLRRFYIGSEIFSKDFHYIIYGSENRGVVWDLINEKEEFLLEGHKGDVLCIDVSEDLGFAVTGSKDLKQNLSYWKLEASPKPVFLNGHKNSVFCVKIAPDGKLCASGSGDKTVKLWDLTAESLLREFSGHSGLVKRVSFTKSSKFVVSGGGDKKVIIWNVEKNKDFIVLESHKSAIQDLFITEDDQFVVSANLTDGIKVWRIRDKMLVYEFYTLDQASEWLVSNQVEKEVIKSYLF